MEDRPVISLKNIAVAVGAFALVAPLLLVALMWSSKLAPAMKTRMAKKAAIAPLVKEAKALGLTYESALADPKLAVGKPAVWCLRRVSAQGGYAPLPGSPEASAAAAAAPAPAKNFIETLYGGVEGRSVYIDNPEKMYPMYNSMRQDCVKTLVTIKKLEAHDFGSGPRYRVEAEFVEYP